MDAALQGDAGQVDALRTTRRDLSLLGAGTGRPPSGRDATPYRFMQPQEHTPQARRARRKGNTMEHEQTLREILEANGLLQDYLAWERLYEATQHSWTPQPDEEACPC